MSEQTLAQKNLDGMLQAGFDKAACRVGYNELHELFSENFEIKLLRTNYQTSINLTGIIDQRRATMSVNKTDDDTLRATIEQMKAMAKGSNQDPAFDIAEAQVHEQFHSGIETGDYDAMVDRVQELVAYAKKTYPILLLRSCGVAFSLRKSCFVNSNGVQFESTRGLYQTNVTFSSKKEKDISSMNYTGYAAFDLDAPIYECGHVDLLMKQSTEQTKTKPIPEKFKGDMIIAPECLMDVLGFITQRISDGPLISGTSVYKDKVNEKVASESLTLHSRPMSDEIAAGYFITNDGYKADNSTIIENGILKGYLLGLYGANKTGLARAVNSGGCYVVDPGNIDLDEMIGTVKKGVLLTRFSGGRPNDRGDFSGVAKNSYYIADGKIQYPISETTVSGNIVDLLKSIKAISRERLNSGRNILPYVHVSGVTAS